MKRGGGEEGGRGKKGEEEEQRAEEAGCETVAVSSRENIRSLRQRHGGGGPFRVGE